MSDGRFSSIRTRAHCEKQLVLLRFEVSGVGGLVAAANKLADAVPQLSQRGIFNFPNLSFHVFSISECDRPQAARIFRFSNQVTSSAARRVAKESRNLDRVVLAGEHVQIHKRRITGGSRLLMFRLYFRGKSFVIFVF